MRYRNLLWALSNWGMQYQLAREIDCSESRLSRCLCGRLTFSKQERAAVARALCFPEAWLFEEFEPPARNDSAKLTHIGA
jgi:hypothetical protein